MNGRVNGIMEESTKLSHASPEHSTDETILGDDPTIKLNHSNTETNNVKNVSEPVGNCNNIAEVTISNGIVGHDKTSQESSIQENETTDNHCNTSDYELNSDTEYDKKEPHIEHKDAAEMDPLQDSNDSAKYEEGNDFAVPDESESSHDEECSKVPEQKEKERHLKFINLDSDKEDSLQEIQSPKKNSPLECSKVPEQKEKERHLKFINLDSDNEDSLQEIQSPKKNSPLKEKADSQNPNSRDCCSLDVQEIVENYVPEEEQPKPVKENKPPLRRSSRAIKRKRYDGQDIQNGDDDSDVELILHDNKRKMTNFNNAKIYEITSRLIKLSSPKKESTVVNLESNRKFSNRGPTMRKNPMAFNNTSLSAQNLYESILARGTTVTPLSSKTLPQTSHTQSSSNTQSSQPVILPSLTDDMFVVEAPSFIVPYVYEKPSIKALKVFLDEFGKELAAQKAAEEQQQEKQKDLAETSVVSDAETKEIPPKVDENSEPTNTDENTKVLEASKEKKARNERRRRRADDDEDLSWDGSLDSHDEDICSDEEDAIVIKHKADTIDDIKDVTDLTVDKIVSGKLDSYFDKTLGKFFMNIGLNLVQGFVQNDLYKQQLKNLNKEKKRGHSTSATEMSLTLLMKNLNLSNANNAPYSFKQLKCEYCSFKTESKLVMSHHLETPHMKNNIYKCNFCGYDSKIPQDILHHMESEHKIRGRLERAPAHHQCANCPFEDNGKGKLARHQVACAKKFKPELNLSPPIDWEPPAKIPKMARARNPFLGSYPNAFNKGQHINNNFGRPIMNNFAPSSIFRPRGRLPMGVPTRPTPIQGIPIIRSATLGRHNNPAQMSSNFSGNNERNMPKSTYQPSISITPLPRQPQPIVTPTANQQNKSTCVICEICDGYIKDLEQLRNHMQWIHKVKIHPKMIHNRPPLNCQKCQFRFFTDQGLERHLLGSHGLVTSSMQIAANKGKDAGRCPVCGRVYQAKLLNHVTRDHKLPLKPAHLSYKCTVCTATFGMYKQFENHVYSKHSVVAKRVMDKGQTSVAAVKSGQSLLKPMMINEEVTITPQSSKSSCE